jgi:hypothetical protein
MPTAAAIPTTPPRTIMDTITDWGLWAYSCARWLMTDALSPWSADRIDRFLTEYLGTISIPWW